MPFYEFKCLDCDNRLELHQSITFNNAIYCPKCNNLMQKVIASNIGIIYNTDGFYATDNKKKE